jgi:hypothetical protein
MSTKQAESSQVNQNQLYATGNLMFDPDKTVKVPVSQILTHACRHWTDFEISTIDSNYDDGDDFGPSASASDSTRVNIACLPDIDDLALPDHSGTCPNLRCLD